MTQTEPPLISVVMATYNGARFLREQLESLRGQTHTRLEIIVRDDGSTDNTYSILQDAAKKDARFKMSQNEKRLGVAANFLRAAREANGDYICWSDQDDVWDADKIERLLAIIRPDAQAMLVCSDLKVCDENLNAVNSSFWKMAGIRPVPGKNDERVLLKNPAPGCSMLFRRAVLEKMKGIPEATPFMHDHLTFVLSAGLGAVRVTDAVLVRYRQHAGNVIGSQNTAVFDETEFLIQLRRRLDYFQKYFGTETRFDCGQLRKFCNQYADPSIFFGNPKYLKYYQAMHPDGLKYGLLGALKCIFPRFFRLVKSRLKGELGS